MSDIDDLLAALKRQIRQIEGMYNASLQAQEVPSELRTTIKNFVENARSPLDYLAHEIAEKYGNKVSLTYYPLAQTAKEFPTRMDRDMPGVRLNRRDIADTIGSYQPYDHAWLRHLNTLARENKHRALTPQTRQEVKRREVHFPGGGSVSWDPASVTFGPGVSIGTEPVNPLTQRTRDTVETIYVDWLFTTIGNSALTTLKEIEKGVTQAVTAIAQTARA